MSKLNMIAVGAVQITDKPGDKDKAPEITEYGPGAPFEAPDQDTYDFLLAQKAAVADDSDVGEAVEEAKEETKEPAKAPAKKAAATKAKTPAKPEEGDGSTDNELV